MLYKVPITYIVHMFLDSQVIILYVLQRSNNIYSQYVPGSQVVQGQVTPLELSPQIHSGNGGINGPASFHRFPLQGQSIQSIEICILES